MIEYINPLHIPLIHVLLLLLLHRPSERRRENPSSPALFLFLFSFVVLLLLLLFLPRTGKKKETEMARVTHDQPSDRISGDDGPDDKNVTEYLDEVVDDVDKRPQGLEPPPLVRAMSPAEREVLEKQLTRKIDIRLLPPVIIMYILNYLDRNNIATARLAGTPGLEEDLGLTDSQYETCVSILFVGYILMVSDSRLSLSLFNGTNLTGCSKYPATCS